MRAISKSQEEFKDKKAFLRRENWKATKQSPRNLMQQKVQILENILDHLENGSNNLIELLKRGRIFIAIFKAVTTSSDKRLLYLIRYSMFECQLIILVPCNKTQKFWKSDKIKFIAWHRSLAKHVANTVVIKSLILCSFLI